MKPLNYVKGNFSKDEEELILFYKAQVRSKKGIPCTVLAL